MDILANMDRWPADQHVERGYNQQDVQLFCVKHAKWQACRLSMKGKPTHEKLAILDAWYHAHIAEHPYITECQVGNYLGALRRGGQLDENNVIRKYI